MTILSQRIVSLIIISQLYFAFGFANGISFNEGNSSADLAPNKDDISFIFAHDKSFCPRFQYDKSNILKTFHSTLQREENVLNITWNRVKGSSKLHHSYFRYYPTLSLGNRIELRWPNTSDIEMVLATRSYSDQMANQKRPNHAENIELMSLSPYSAEECVYSVFPKIESELNIVFGLCGFVFACWYSIFYKENGSKSLTCIALFSMLGIALGFEIFFPSFAILLGAYISYKTAPKLFRLSTQRFFGSIHGEIFRVKLKILPFCFCVGLVNLLVFQITFKLVLFACINNFIVLSACCLLLKKHINFKNSSEGNSEELRLNCKNYNRTRSSKIPQKNWQACGLGLSKRTEYISVVGMSCRFANGVNSKDAFWDLLVKGGSVIGSYPENRLEDLAFKRFYNPTRNVPGKHYTLKGAFLDEIAGFDAQFFGISPAECRAMDPQQRLLLQSVYEAIEDAGMRLEDLQACRAGVYVGLMNLDYGRLLLDDGNVPNIDEFASTGITASTAANRISFSLNLNGPSLTVDTACSSSLSALNIAVTHLKSRECDVAIVCAPNLILARYFHTACCRTGLLAEDGRCKSFDAKGDGYGRGEGMAVVILKPTQTALMDHDEPYAQILSCGLNNDGQTAIPMTAPSDRMQAELARRVLKESGLRKTDVQYVETHGTGTAVGDVVEMRSVSEVYANTSSRVLRIGSVKSNINHTESTAGLAGLIKVCLMIKNGCFVPTVNVQELKPQLKIAQRKMVVQTELEPWPAVDGKPRTAAVCSYGYGGANAHVIVQEVQSTPSTESCARKREIWMSTLSARSREALKMMAGRFSEWFEQKPDNDWVLKGNVCYTLNNRRSIHSHKLVLTFNSFKQAANLLKLFAKDGPGWQKYIVVNDNPTSIKKLAFIYGGQGNCWYDMVSELMKNEPKFVESIQQIDGILEELQISWRLVEKLGRMDTCDVPIQENPIAQMALFGVHYSMTQLLKSWGITPSAVVGHSLGEISASCAAHVISLEEAVQLILLRAELQHKCSVTGCMLAVGMSPENVERVIRKLNLVTRVSIAAVNSPVGVVLSGDQQFITAVEEYLQTKHGDVFCKRLGSTRAFHSQEMDCIKEEFVKGCERLEINPGRPTIPFYSTVTGIQTSHLTSAHWWDNIREPVLFCSAVHNMISDGHKVFIEINVVPQFPRYIHEISASFESEKTPGQPAVTLVETLPRKSEKHRYLSFLRNCPSTLYTQGFPIAWDKIQGSGTKTFIRCPSYPWQERKYWYRECEPSEHVRPLVSKTDLRATLNTPDESTFDRTTLNSGLTHPLLGKAVATVAYSGMHAWTSEIDVFTLPYLKDHRFQSSEDSVIPGAVYVEMGLALALHMFPDVLPRLHDIMFENLLTLSTNEIARFCTQLDTTGRPGTRHDYQITTLEGSGSEVLVSRGLVSFGETAHHCNKVKSRASNSTKIANIKSRLIKQPLGIFNTERVNRRFAYGPQFSLIAETWCSGTEAFCSVVLTEEIRSSLAVYVVHPAIIDACFQSLFLLKSSVEKPVPYGAADIRLHHRNFTKVMYCHVVNHVGDHVANPDCFQEHVCDMVLMDCHGNAVLLIKKFKMVDLSNLRPSTTLNDVSYQIQWQQVAAETRDIIDHKVWVIVRDHCGFTEMFTSSLPKEDPRFVFEFPEKSSLTRDAFSEVLEKAIEVFKCGGFKRICIVNFLPVDNRSLLPDWKNFHQAHYQAFESSLLLLQGVLVSKHSESVQLVLVTCGSVSFGTNDASNPAFPWSSTLLGFRRTLAEELTSPKTTIIDFQENPSEADFQLMLRDLQREAIDEEIVYHNGRRHLNQIKRFHSVPPENVKLQSQVDCREVKENILTGLIKDESNLRKNLPKRDATNKSFSTQTAAPKLDGYDCPQVFKLSFSSGHTNLVKTQRSVPANNLVEMKVLQACPLLQRTWSKASDKVVVCGKLTTNYQNFSPGEFLLAVGDASELGNFITVEKRSLIKLGKNLSSQQATALSFPMAFSIYILREVVRDCKGKTVLVYTDQELHACVFASVASSLDACVVYVAGNTEYKSRFSDFGATYLSSEYGLLFEDGENEAEIIFDVACFLAKPSPGFVQRVVKHLRDYGKIISFVDNTCGSYDVSVSGNVSFLAAKIDEITNDATRFEQLLADCTALLSDKGYLSKFKHLPCHSTSIFDTLSSSHEKDVMNNESTSNGSLTLSTISFECEKKCRKFKFSNMPFDPKCLRGDRSYLVVGGVRGFGFEVVYWLLQNGAKTIICTARSAPSQSKMVEVARLEKQTGARILLRQADVTSWEDMLEIVKELEGLSGLAGIVFTAMVLEDQRIKDADLETCARVVATKVQGSVILHQLSLRLDLDFFIMFSSIAGIVGNVGQLAYSAANTFLDSLCEYRRNKLGLTALSVAWGTMGGAGILERSKDIASLFQSYGFRIMSCNQGLKFLEEFLTKHSDRSQIIICDIDWSTYLKSSAYILHRSPRLQSLNNETLVLNKANDITGAMSLEQLACLDPGQRRKTVEDFIRRLLSTWTETDCHEVDLNLALYKYGVDSIGAANMSLRIRNGIGAIFEIYYFIQPKTTGVTIVNDTLEQVRNFQRDHLNTENDWKPKNKLDGESNAQGNITGDELKSEDDVKVVPLYVPDDPLIKVFMLHSSHKSALANSPFASGFTNQENVALYSIGTDDVMFENEDYGTVRSLAKQYIESIKTVQKIGPYYLAGFSFGGILCYEVACQLTQGAEVVAMVTMLDTMPWFPKATVKDKNPDFQQFQDFLAADLKDKMVERFLKSTALGSLGFTQAEFEDLFKEFGPGDKLISALQEKAQKINVSLGDVSAHVASLKHQSERACHAHIEWQPPEVKYEQTISYVRCEMVDEAKQSYVSWNPVELWESLTNNIDVITLPCGHFELLDQPYAEICGLVIMSTAVVKHRSLTEWQPSPRSNQEQRLVGFLKSAAELAIVCDDDLVTAKLWLSEDESRFSICFENKIRRKKIELQLSDIRNIIPGKYAMFHCKKKMKLVDENLIISLILTCNQQYHIVCQDWRQRDYIMDAFEVLFETPLIRFCY